MEVKESEKIYLSPNVFFYSNSYYYEDELSKKKHKN